MLTLLVALTFQAQSLGVLESHSDVGAPPRAGAVQFDNGEYRVTGGGANMWGAADAFHFVHKRLAGDFTLSADVRFLGEGKNPHRKLALIVRQSLAPDAAYADVAVHGDGLTALQYRRLSGAQTAEIRSNVKAPSHLLLERRGDRIIVDTGETLTLELPMSGPVYVGLAVCSHEAEALETAVFSNVRLFTGKRPLVMGVAHVALFVKDIAASRAFYKDYLGYGEPFDLKNPDGTLSLTFLKINDRQYLELFPEREAGSDRFNHVSVEVDDAEAMRGYLAAHGVKVPEKAGIGRTKNANFTIKDPQGHGLEFVQYLPDSWSSREHGKFLPSTRISGRMPHFGIIVTALEPALRFYRDLLGFEETWRGSRDGKQLSWVNLKVPASGDYIELMLYPEMPAKDKRGTPHHLCLEVNDIEKARAALAGRPGYARPLEVRTGINGKRQLNLYDPDGTRVELMEPTTVSGQPVPPSTAPPPQ